MSKALLGLLLILITSPGLAKCVVEILDKDGDPVGYNPYVGDTCPGPKQRCEAALSKLNRPDLSCEITLDIGVQQKTTQSAARK